MRLWHILPEEPFVQAVLRSTRRLLLTCLGMGTLVLPAVNSMCLVVSPTFTSAAPTETQRPGKATSSHIGAAMALLATLEQARVLPPENTKEANRIIKSVIQLQSLFTKTTDPVVQEFMQRAVANKREEQATEVLAQFYSAGWTPEVLEALADTVAHGQTEELARLTPGLASVNLSVDDLQHFTQLVRDSERALADGGKNFHDVFLSHRKTMPGAAGRSLQ